VTLPACRTRKRWRRSDPGDRGPCKRLWCKGCSISTRGLRCPKAGAHRLPSAARL